MIFEYHHASKHDPALIELLTAAAATRRGVRLRLFGLSMVPSIRNGEVVRVRRAEREALRVGDVVLCHGEGRLLAHRILRLTADGLVTKGDTIRRADPPIEYEQIVGRVEAVERGGRERLLDGQAARWVAGLTARLSMPYSWAFHAVIAARRSLLRRLSDRRLFRRLRRRLRPIPFEVRPGRPDDAGRLAPLHLDARPHLPFPFAFEEVKAALEGPLECLVATTPQTAVGWALGRPLPGGEWRLETLYVRQAYRGLGVGSALLDAVQLRMEAAGAGRLCGPALDSDPVRHLLAARGLRPDGGAWTHAHRQETLIV